MVASAIAPAFFLAGIFFLNFLSRLLLSPMLPVIEEDLGIGHGTAGTLFLSMTLGYLISMMASGFLTSRITHKSAIAFSSIVLGLALFVTAKSPDLNGLYFGMLLTGLASGLYLPSGVATLTTLVDRRHWGKAMAIHEMAPNMGFVVAPVLAGLLLRWWTWRWVMDMIGVAAVMAGLMHAVLGRGGGFTGVVPDFAAVRTFVMRRDSWIMIAFFSAAIAGSLGIYSMLPLFLVKGHEMDLVDANLFLTITRLPCMVMAFLAGWVADRLGLKMVIGLSFFASGLSAIAMGFLDGGLLATAVFLQPLFAVAFFPAGFSALSKIGGDERSRNIVVSLTIPLAFMLGGGLIPALIGMAGDLGSFSGGVAAAGFFITSVLLLMPLLRIPD